MKPHAVCVPCLREGTLQCRASLLHKQHKQQNSINSITATLKARSSKKSAPQIGSCVARRRPGRTVTVSVSSCRLGVGVPCASVCSGGGRARARARERVCACRSRVHKFPVLYAPHACHLNANPPHLNWARPGCRG